MDTKLAQFRVSGSDAFLSAASDVSGIAFDGNVVLSGTVDPTLAKIARGAAELERAKNGLLYPRDPAIDAVGAPRDLAPIGLEEVGVDWYPKPKDASPFESSGRRVTIAPGVDARQAIIDIERVLRSEHQIVPGARNDFDLSDRKQFLEMQQEAEKIFS